MDQGELRELEEATANLAHEAGKLLLQRFGRPLKVEYKGEGHNHPVTDVDLASESFLKEEISRRFPRHTIIAEETPPGEEGDGDVVWVLDPLDGTVNYLNGLALFGVSVGVLEAGRPVVGALFVPSPTNAQGSVLHAREGGGAFAGTRPIHVAEGDRTDGRRLAAYPASFGRAYRFQQELWHNLGQVRATGSITYELAQVATGAFQYAVIGGPRLWDVAGGVVVVREAGGVALTRLKGHGGWKELDRFQGASQEGVSGSRCLAQWRAPVIAANPQVAWFVASRLRRRRMLLHRLRRWFRRGGREQAATPPKGHQTQGQGRSR